MIELNITFDPATGVVNASGPLDNEMLAFWLLEKAKDITKAYNAKPAPKLQTIGAIGALASNGRH